MRRGGAGTPESSSVEGVRPVTERTFRRLGAGTVLLALIAVIIPVVFGGQAMLIAQGAVLSCAAAAAALVGAVGVTRTRGRERLWRALLELFLIFVVLGAADWTYRYPRQHQTMPLGPAEALFLVPAALALVGLLWLPVESDRRDDPVLSLGREGRPRYSDPLVVLDALVVVASMLLIVWIAALGRIVGSGVHGWPFVTAMVFPLWGMLAVTEVVLLGAFRPPRNGRALLLIGLGLAIQILPDSAVVILTLHRAQAVETTAPYWAGLAIAPPLIALGLVAPERRRSTPGTRDPALITPSWVGRPSWPWIHVYVPYLPLTVTVVIILGLAASGAALGGVLLYLALILAMLVAFRQLVTVAQNVRLLVEVQAAQVRLRYQAFHDLLTGLPNRAYFTGELERAVGEHRSVGRPVAVMFVDLDDFKAVNDTLGHAAGDDLLAGVAARLRGAVRGNDLVARLGGDEFAVLLAKADQTGDPAITADRAGREVLAAMGPPFSLHGHLRNVHASVGLAMADNEAPVEVAEQLMHRADSAMYAAKRDAKGGLVRDDLHRSTSARNGDVGDSVIATLTGDATAGRLAVCYQPIRCLNDGRIVAVEASPCWTGSSNLPQPARDLLAAAEREGSTDELQSRLLNRACHDLRVVRQRLHAPVRLHVNVSPNSLGNEALLDLIRESLHRHHLDADALVLEIANVARIPDLATAGPYLEQLARTGVRIALDEVGADDSSLGALHKWPITLIKLTPELSADLLAVDQPPDRGLRAVRSALIGIAAATGMTVAVDGIATEPQLAALRTAGCELGQGDLLGPPQTLVDLFAAGATMNGALT
ncbi:EAL domain-containing protein [Frankia sp. AgB1.9]|uniref:putative bifunctional diguanylate cyclase/phosphodiesterase n=1 Tax=unclassified Frankia TaxID=2632575 RepID=UPI001933EDD2|nr:MULTISPECIES: diguanylate cyclase [unclassified Frankia]MBL7490835.1 EAL domain-containing protein [Frankia sp. AgW1.1]MBL7551018.1 EAL domain-containing protein [Frankia sp. AgB1.9]MBL7621201.1 EAL domain-containing protein [Frankia sp. AgB1.8]